MLFKLLEKDCSLAMHLNDFQPNEIITFSFKNKSVRASSCNVLDENLIVRYYMYRFGRACEFRKIIPWGRFFWR